MSEAGREAMDDRPQERQISAEKAAALLDRAAKLDASAGKWVDIAELREAALEAGISATAFDRALAELESRRAVAEAVSVSARASTAAATTATYPARLVSSVVMLSVGFLIGGLAMLLTGLFGEAAIGFSLILAFLVFLGALIKGVRRGSVLDFEIDLSMLWVGFTFMMMLMMPFAAEAILARMALFGAMGGIGGGALISMARRPEPKALPEPD
jgi:hypothetical protein